MALSWAHISTKAADVAKLLLLNKRLYFISSHAEYGVAPPPPNRNRNTITRSGLPPNYETDSLHGPCATFPLIFVKVGGLVVFVILLTYKQTNKQTNADENATSFAEVVSN